MEQISFFLLKVKGLENKNYEEQLRCFFLSGGDWGETPLLSITTWKEAAVKWVSVSFLRW